MQQLRTPPLARDPPQRVDGMNWPTVPWRAANSRRMKDLRSFTAPTRSFWTCCRPPIASAAAGGAIRSASISSLTPRAGLAAKTAAIAPNPAFPSPTSPGMLCCRPSRSSTAPARRSNARRRPIASSLPAAVPAGGSWTWWPNVVPKIKQQYSLEICVSSGLLDQEQARRLKQSGVDRVNHNLNTSRRFYPQICTTHTFEDRLDTLWAVRNAGMEICSGGIVGMGEDDADVVELALELGRLGVEALPVNFFTPIEGTPVTAARPKGLTPRYCLKALALFRLANPRCDLRAAAGREIHLGWMQPLALYAANSMFVGDYLTTKGQPPTEDYRMIEEMGFAVVVE